MIRAQYYILHISTVKTQLNGAYTTVSIDVNKTSQLLRQEKITYGNVCPSKVDHKNIKITTHIYSTV